jgi:hypothetical protein
VVVAVLVDLMRIKSLFQNKKTPGVAAERFIINRSNSYLLQDYDKFKVVDCLECFKPKRNWGLATPPNH